MYLGIDIGGTKVEFASLSDDEITILRREATPKNYESMIKLITNVVSGLGYVRSIGIGLPGTFTSKEITWAPNIPYLKGKNLAKDLSKLSGVEVVIGNDAQLALLGESWKGVAISVSDAILISIGTGIGGAIMVGHKIIKGNNGAAGAFGWLNLDINVEPVENHGYLEYHASGSALTRMGINMTPVLSPYEIVEGANKGQTECVEIINNVGGLLGTSIGAIASILDPEMVVISGGLSDAFDSFESSLLRNFRKYSSNGLSSLPIVKSKLGNKSGVYGAVRLAMIKEKTWI